MIFLSTGNKTDENNYSYCITEVSDSGCVIVKIDVINGMMSSCQTFDDKNNKYLTIINKVNEQVFYDAESKIVLLSKDDEDEVTYRLVHGYQKDTGYIASLFKFILDLIEKSKDKNEIINFITSKYDNINAFYVLCKNYMFYRRRKIKEFENTISIGQFMSNKGE